MMEISQFSNNNQINHSIFIQNNQNIENKVKSIVSQIPGKIKNVSFMYNSQSISKAKITVVVASKEEAEKIRQSIDEEIDIKVIIREESKNEEPSKSDNSTRNIQNDATKDKEDLKKFSTNIYSYNRGPDGKIYGIIKEEKNKSIETYLDSSKDRKINNNLREKYINIYKRYNFKNVIINENKYNKNFSLNI